MKLIKKVSQAIAVVGKVLNSKSTSTQDTYSCDYLNGTVLYENGSGTNSEFTINDDISNYSKIEVHYSITGSLFKKIDMFPVMDNIINQAPLNLNYLSSDNTIQIYTCNISINETSVTFTRGGSYNQSTSQTTTTNNLLVSKIIGYK